MPQQQAAADEAGAEHGCNGGIETHPAGAANEQKMAQHVYDSLPIAERHDLLMGLNPADFVSDRHRVTLPGVAEAARLSYNELPYPYQCAVSYHFAS